MPMFVTDSPMNDNTGQAQPAPPYSQRITYDHPRPLPAHPHGGSRVAILWDKNAEYFFKINKLKLNTPHPSLTCYGHGLAYSGD